MRKSVLFFTSSLVIFFLTTCKKESNSTEADIDAGDFSAVIDGNSWQPGKHYAIYYPQWHQLYIYAEDRTGFNLLSGINTDSVNPVKSYLLEPNGENVAYLREGRDYGILRSSDHDVADAGGTFSLTLFDTINKKISDTLEFMCYYPDLQTRFSFSSGNFIDIPLTISTEDFDGNYAKAIASGVNACAWQSKGKSFSRVTCISAGIDKRLEVKLSPAAGGRYLSFFIPLNSSTGMHQITPYWSPDFDCGNLAISSVFNPDNYEKIYYAVSGTFDITAIDTLSKRISANFDVILKDSSVPQKTLHFSNGKLSVNNWDEY